MLQIFNNIWLNSVFGLAIILVITITNLILSRRKTIPILLLDQAVFSIIAVILFGWPCIIYASLCVLLVGYKRFREISDPDIPTYNYSENIYSISRLVNSFGSTKDIVVGKILPISRKTIKYNMKPVAVSDTILSGGTLITGATGSGKTTTLISILKQGIKLRKPVVFFDYKGETEILDNLQEFCNKNNVPYYEFSARTSSFSYDPLKQLNETGKVEAILNTRKWAADGADEHYKTSMQLAIQNLVSEYDKYRLEHDDTSNYVIGLYDYCKQYQPSANDRDGFNTVIKMLEILLSSRARDLFNDDKEEFSFQRDDCYVVCFSFVSANKALATSLSSFVFQDLMDRGTNRHYDPKLLLCIDEFATLENSTVIKDILEKGRSGGIQTIVSILDINDIANKTSIYFVNAILGTINSYIFHAGSTKQAAEVLSGVQKYQLDSDIMNLRKPYGKNPPTALFISKYPILNKKGSQEFYKIVPLNYKDKSTAEEKTTAANQQIGGIFNSEDLE